MEALDTSILRLLRTFTTEEEKERYYTEDNKATRREKHTFHNFIKTAQIPFRTNDGFERGPEWLAGTDMVGKEHLSLGQRIEESCFAVNPQERSSGIAIVQASGFGKTKSALALSESFYVIPWFLYPFNKLLVELITSQREGFREFIGRFDGLRNKIPSQEEIQNFSSYCLNLTHLSLLSLFAFVTEFLPYTCAGESDTYYNRHRFAFTMWNSEFIATWERDWFQNHAETPRNERAFRDLKASVIEKLKDVCVRHKVVIFLDEFHIPMGSCHGYVSHQQNTCAKDWIKEVTSREAANGEECTNLSYQFRDIIVREYLSDNELTFVLCSTCMKVWTVLESDMSPFGRNCFFQFVSIHFFEIEDVVFMLRKYFHLHDAFF